MDDKRDKSSRDKQRYQPKPERTYIRSVTKAAAHPVRANILKALKEGEQSTLDLESVTGENRYNLYHHLNILQDAGLIDHKIFENKKMYYSARPENPESFVAIIGEDEISRHKKEIHKLIDAVNNMEQGPVPDPDRIERVEIYFNYGDKKGE